ncbi:MAG: hypothetical protein AB1439_01475 [candidate division FCPU426 bacterium]
MRTSRVVVAVLTAAVLLAGSGTASLAAKGKAAGVGNSLAKTMRDMGFDYQHAQWTSQMTQTEEGGKVTKTSSQIWISGDKMRMETKDRRTGEQMIIIGDGKDEYIYNPKEKTATKMGAMMRGMFTGMMDSEAFQQAAERRKNAKKSGTETVSGKPCTIYAYQQTFGGLTSDVKEWVWTGKNFPMKTIVSTPKQAMTMMGMKTTVPASTTESVVTDLVLNKAVPASMFELPKGAKVQDMDKMMQGGQGGEDEEEDEGEDEGGDEGGDDGQGKDQIPPEVQKMMKGLF